MKTNTYHAYSYKDLLEAATAPTATQVDIDTLGEWFREYGDCYWNGEHYDADGLRVCPVYEWDEETDTGEIVRYELH